MLRPALLVLLFATLAAHASEKMTFRVGRLDRTCVLHLPAGLDPHQPVPLVFVLHGGGGHGAQIEKSTRFDALADRENFIVAYPDGVDHHWNDGRENNSKAFRENVDDLAFFDALVTAVGQRHPVDPKRIYATGISNGGFMSYTLAARRANVFAAVAPVSGGIGDDLAAHFAPAAAVSLLVLQGTADPLVPYGGGEVMRNRGRFVSTDDAIKLWLKADACAPAPVRAELPDRDRFDGCRVTTFTWTNPKNNVAVCLYRIEGGGHTWAGGSQYLPRLIVGRVCRDFDATETIWAFFQTHPKP